MERRPFLEREEITQVLAIGMALANKEILRRLDPLDFRANLAAVVKQMQEANGAVPRELDLWLEYFATGVARGEGQKASDFVLGRLRSDGVLRQAARELPGRTNLDGLLLRMDRLLKERKDKS